MSSAKQVISDAVLEQAALWFIRQEQQQDKHCVQDNVKQQQEFTVWLQNTEHQLAWQKILQVSQTFATVKEVEQIEQVDIASNTLTNLHQPSQSFSRRNMLKSFAVAAFVGITWQSSPNIRQYVYSRQAQLQTSVGATHKQYLSDGSQIWLNTNSALDEIFTQDKRELVLYHGEVYIKTAKDKQRPLFVSANLASRPVTYTALGTEFVVEQGHQSSQLRVFHGRVAIDYNQQRLIVASGEQVTITGSGFGVKTVAQKDSLAWQQRELRAKDISLADFCRQLERYHSGIITLSDQASKLRVVGVFPIFDLDASLQMLAQSLPITISQHIPWWTRIN